MEPIAHTVLVGCGCPAAGAPAARGQAGGRGAVPGAAFPAIAIAIQQHRVRDLISANLGIFSKCELPHISLDA
jgi:hypothetical protein